MLTRALLVASVVVAIAVSAGSTPLRADDEVRVEVRLEHRYYYVGQAIDATVAVVPAGDGRLRNPVKAPLVPGIQVRASDGGALASSRGAKTVEPDRPSIVSADAPYAVDVDLTQVFEDLRTPGTYEVRWARGGRVSEPRPVVVIPPFDASAQYAARLETDLGTIFLVLLTHESPLAVKTFVDLARAGFYDEMPFHDVQPSGITAGAARYADPPEAPLYYPAELGGLVVRPGTVVVRPVRPSPPTNGSAFTIALDSLPAWTGQVTVLGQVIGGLDIVGRIARIGPDAPEPIRIRRVTIESRPAPTPGS